MPDRITMQLAADAPMAPRTDRSAGTAYQISTARPAFVSARIYLVCNLAQSVMAQLFVGPAAASLVEQERESLDLTGSVTLSIIAVATLGVTEKRRTHLRAWVPPGHFYKVTLSGTGQMTFEQAMERVF